MNADVLEKYRKAGYIAAKAREYGASLIKPGTSYLVVVEKVENKIREMGGEPAFPVNISVNEVAAHFTPKHDDNSHIFKAGDVVKIDVGVHVDGYIADTAITVEVEDERHSSLLESTEEALHAAVKVIREGINIGEIGKVIHHVIENRGFETIDNLSGHSLKRYTLHAGVSIPNVPTNSKVSLKEGDVIAIEPFASTGAGHVESKGQSNIYRYIRQPILRDARARILVRKLRERFSTLPFAERWCADIIPNASIRLNQLAKMGCIHHYSMLIDDGIVSQHEHTVIVTKDGCEVIT